LSFDQQRDANHNAVTGNITKSITFLKHHQQGNACHERNNPVQNRMTYLKTTPVIIILFSFSGCSPRANKPLQRVYITTDKNVRIISIDGKVPVRSSVKPGLLPTDSSNLRQLYIAAKKLYKAEKKAGTQVGKISDVYFVPRSNNPLAMELDFDSTQKTIYLEPKKNYGRFLNMRYVFRLKDSMDLLAYKRWIYPKKNVITIAGNDIRISRLAPEKKNAIYGSISPGVQIFNLKKDNGQYNSAGIVGAEIGLDYFYRENRFLSFNIGAATDAVPLPIDYFGPAYIERGSAVYTSIRDNIIKGRFDIGYGVSISRLYWTATPIDYMPGATGSKVRTTGLGLSLSAHYKMKQNIRVGLLYQPNLININYTPVFAYQHFMAVQFTWSLHGRNKPGKK
jgi:hypothetical protein